MGLAEAVRAYRRAGVDMAVFIYAMEKHPTFAPLAQIILEVMTMGSLETVVSEISVLETLVMPYRQQDIAAEQRYLIFFDTCLNLTVYPLDRAVAQRAAQLRAAHAWLRTPDAIIIAASLLYDAEVVVTNDDRWKRIAELPVLVLKDYAPNP